MYTPSLKRARELLNAECARLKLEPLDSDQAALLADHDAAFALLADLENLCAIVTEATALIRANHYNAAGQRRPTNLEAILKARKFVIEDTGGHCHALFFSLNAGYVLITDLSGGDIPSATDETVLCGVYDNDGLPVGDDTAEGRDPCEEIPVAVLDAWLDEIARAER